MSYCEESVHVLCEDVIIYIAEFCDIGEIDAIARISIKYKILMQYIFRHIKNFKPYFQMPDERADSRTLSKLIYRDNSLLYRHFEHEPDIIKKYQEIDQRMIDSSDGITAELGMKFYYLLQEYDKYCLMSSNYDGLQTVYYVWHEELKRLFIGTRYANLGTVKAILGEGCLGIYSSYYTDCFYRDQNGKIIYTIKGESEIKSLDCNYLIWLASMNPHREVYQFFCRFQDMYILDYFFENYKSDNKIEQYFLLNNLTDCNILICRYDESSPESFDIKYHDFMLVTKDRIIPKNELLDQENASVKTE